MPRKGKKNKFHGTPSWQVPKDSTDCEAHDDEASTSVVPDSDRCVHPSIERNAKIKAKRSPVKEISSAERSSGFRLIDMHCLSDVLKDLHA